MKPSEVRDWLGKYLLVFTIVLGGYIILFAGKDTALLRIRREVGLDCFQLIIPTLLGQIAMVFRFFSAKKRPSDDEDLAMPTWIIKWPPVLLAGLVVFTIALMFIGNVGQAQLWAPSEDDFKMIILFYVSVLNATTVLVMSRYFELPAEPAAGP